MASLHLVGIIDPLYLIIFWLIISLDIKCFKLMFKACALSADNKEDIQRIFVVSDNDYFFLNKREKGDL